ncbi:uncharacterized protein LOC108906313 [Anoplophora glabripennis]|uniref:uncharacterized protein LOC108906313 n=1 Tax=Anoplophora glabripennis TaxID=217634 RepID=UPI000873DB4E|nr:uncharacterized protein LOC108906313 [Anoplophora glabripennis]
MIILFHCISIIIFQLLRSRKRIKMFQKFMSNKSFTEANSVNVDEDLEFNLKFDPPVFRQRYGRVYETLLNERLRTKITSLVDFGCAEFSLFVFIKRLSNLNTIFFVDIDEDLLNQYAGKLHPLTIEHLKRRHEPLEVCVFAGSVADPDCRLLNMDAVTAIEVIEHLYPDVLDAFPYNVFNHINPKVVIITTPNADFNVLFSDDLNRLRHYDHKFEWSREQFEEWANNIAIRFPDYTVSFSGIGEGPQGTEHLGQCSQMAVFIRKDLLSDDYLPETYYSSCLCDNNSPCKGLTSQSNLSCSCVCASCSPSASYGVCTYYTCSKQSVLYETDREQMSSYSTYYKLIEKVVYPFERDNRTENEKMRDEFNYRITHLGQAWGRFFVEERNRSEIPLQDLVYGPTGFDITESEVEKLLTGLGYRVEECRIQETGLLQNCVIYEPVMEEISSTSEASGYDSDFTKHQLNEESLSDWDEPNFKKESGKSCDNRKDMTCVGMTSREEPVEPVTDIEDEKKQQDSLFDSGYQKSLSLMDDSPQTPLEELEETDVFEDTTSTPSLTSEDNKVHLKKASTLEKHSFVPPPAPDFTKFKFDLNRINEMDKFHNIPPGRTFFNHFVPPPEVLKKSFLKDKDSLPGPSSVPSKKRKKVRKSFQSDVDDDSPFEDVKSITNCLIENTLNKLDVKEDKQNLIEYVEPEPEPPPEAEEPPQVNEMAVVQELPQIHEEAPVVENGDLANNNRDFEGNNYIAQEEAVENIGNDIVNDNLEPVEELPQIREENANIDNNNRNNELLRVIEDPLVIVAEGGNVENADNAQAADNLIGEASREALFDPNSEQDSLDDFEISAALHETDNVVSIVNTGNNVVFIGVHPTPEENESGLMNDQNIFPHWLLQILGSQVVGEGENPAGSQEEPHFYCQGDGLGVHPSVIAVEIDEEEDTTDSSNNTADTAELEQDPSYQDMNSLPEDSQTAPLESNTIPLDPHPEEEQPLVPTASHHHESNSSTDAGASGST